MMKKVLVIALLLGLAAGLFACKEKEKTEIVLPTSATTMAETTTLSEEESLWLAEYEEQYPFTYKAGGFTIRYYVENGEAVISDGGWEGDESGTFIVPLTIEGMPVRWLDGVGEVLLRKLHCAEIIVPAGIKTIGMDISGAETVRLGPDVESFMLSRSYAGRFEVDPKNEYLSDINGVLFSKDGHILMQYPTGRSSARYAIPNGVEAIAEGALWFSRPVELKEVVVPSSVTGFPDSLDDLINTLGYQLTFVVMSGSAAEAYFKRQMQSEAYKKVMEEDGVEPFLLQVQGLG